jgi:hypothetical protein
MQLAEPLDSANPHPACLGVKLTTLNCGFWLILMCAIVKFNSMNCGDANRQMIMETKPPEQVGRLCFGATAKSRTARNSMCRTH